MTYNSRVRICALLIALASGSAHADGESAVSMSVGWATFSVPGKPMDRQAPPTLSPDVGGMAAVSYERSISSDFGLRAELAGGLYYGGGQAKQGKLSFSGLGDAGIVYRFDVLKYVPFAFVGLGGVAAGGGPIDRGADFVLVLGGGLDWLVSRERSYGLEVRVGSFGGDITIVTFGVRGTVRWGFL
jgi:hypothetical protein